MTCCCLHWMMWLKTKIFPLALILLLAAAPAQAGLFGLKSSDRQEFVRARETYARGDYAQAVTELSNYIYKIKNIKRREARAYRLLGLSYEQLNLPEKALEAYQEALEFHQKDIPLLLAAAALYQRTGLTDQSIPLYQRVLEQDPDNLEALAGQAENYLNVGFYSKAREYYDTFFALNPQAPALHRARYAYTFLRQRDYENAFINIVMAQTEDPENVRYWIISAYAYKKLGRPEQALADLDMAISLAPDQPLLKALRSMWLYQQQDFAASLQQARDLLKTNPHDELALFMLYMNLKDTHPAQARRALQQIQQLDTDSLATRVADKLLDK